MSAHVDRDGRARELAAARALHGRLRALGRVEAPAGLLGVVLGEVGLTDRHLSLQTAIGTVYVAFSRRQDGPPESYHIRGVAPAVDDAAFERTYRARTGRSARRADAAPPGLLEAIQAHLSGQLTDGEGRGDALELDLTGLSEFERAVLLKAREIPRGEVRPYGWIAREIGRPGAVRAVGSALNKNPIPLLIPCHRVVKSDGRLGEYAFGPALKRSLLASEGLDLAYVEALAQAGVRFVAEESSTEICLPTCRWVRDVPPERLRRFSSAAQALAAGYTGCADCRPVGAAV